MEPLGTRILDTVVRPYSARTVTVTLHFGYEMARVRYVRDIRTMWRASLPILPAAESGESGSGASGPVRQRGPYASGTAERPLEMQVWSVAPLALVLYCFIKVGLAALA